MSDKKTNFDDVAKTAVDTAAIKSINASCHKAGSRGIFRFLVNSKTLSIIRTHGLSTASSARPGVVKRSATRRVSFMP